MTSTDTPQRDARLKAGVGLCALARAMRISAPYLLDLERGHRTFSDRLLALHGRELKKLSDKTQR